MERKIYLTKEWNPEKIVIGNINDKKINIFYPKENEEGSFNPLVIQTPKLKIPFDGEEKRSKDGQVFVKNIQLSASPVGGQSNKNNIKSFVEKINAIDENIKAQVGGSKKMSNSFRQGRNTDFAPNMRISIPFRDECCKTAIYDSKDDKTDVSSITKGIIVSVILRLDSLWIGAQSMGINWVAEQIKIYEKPAPIKKFLKFKQED